MLTSVYASPLSRPARLRVAVASAVILHLLLVLLIPNIPPLLIPAIDRGHSLSVYLRSGQQQEPLNQSLSNPGDTQDQLVERSAAASQLPSTRTGAADEFSEPSTEADSDRQDPVSSQASGQDNTTGVAPSLFITQSMIRLFAREEAIEAAERNPQQLERFNRSFRSQVNFRKRPRSEEFRDIYGDYYVRNQASDGDICFMQQQEQQPDEFSFTTVYFFRCGKQPKNFELPSSDPATQ